MKLKSYARYFLYALAIFFLMLLHQRIGIVWKQDFLTGYEYKLTFPFFSLVMMVLVGMLLGFDHFRAVWKQEGKWKINVPKLIFWGIPSLLFSLSYILMFIQIENVHSIVSPILFLFPYIATYIPLFQLILGYTVLTSFQKGNPSSEVHTPSSPS